MRRAHAALFLLTLLCGGCARACGKTTSPNTFEEEQRKGASENPDNIKLEIRADQSSYALGEPIKITLRFSATRPNAKIDLARYTRFEPPIEHDIVKVEGDDWVDPIASWPTDRESGGGMAANPKFPALSDPVETTIVLNEWARFTKPGKKRAFVESRRLRDPMHATVYSNIVDFEVRSDSAWADKRLAELQHDLKNPDNVRAIGYLETKSALSVLMGDYCKDSREVTALALYRSPFRSDLSDWLWRGLSDRDCAITDSYISFLNRVAVGDSGLKVPDLSKKQGAALAMSAITAINPSTSSFKPDPKLDQLRERLAPVLSLLPEKQLEWALDTQWRALEHPAMRDQLEILVKQARPRGSSLRSISDLALEHFLELDYDAGRALILSELARPEGVRLSFTGKTLSRLKDGEHPELDAPLLAGLKADMTDGATMELRSEVAGRYGSKAITPQLMQIFRDSRYFHVGLAPHLWRNDRAKTEALLRDADAYELARISEHLWNDTMEALTVKQLKGSNGSTAASLLALRGGPNAEQALLAHLKQDSAEHTFEREIVSAFRTATNWMLTPEKALMLKDLCSSDTRNELSIDSRWGEDKKSPDLVLWSHRGGGVTGWLGPYQITNVEELERRIRQLPEGYALRSSMNPNDVDPALLEKIRAWATEKRLSIKAK